MAVYSTKEELEKIANYLIAYMKIPYFQDDSIPGKIMEKIISLVHEADQLPTYDYVDVVKAGHHGWSIKSTKEDTPLTWKRAKISNKSKLIEASLKSDDGLKVLGDAIIDFCNSHAVESMNKFKLTDICYSRLIVLHDNTAIYFERMLCNKTNPVIFKKEDYKWEWSIQKEAKKKEQLTALHGKNIHTGKKAFAWHGLSENQLHFSGEKDWWPDIEMPTKSGDINYSADCHAIAFKLDTFKVDWDKLVEFLNNSPS